MAHSEFEFRDCVDSGKNVIDEWLSAQPVGVRAEFASLFAYLEVSPITEWKPLKVKNLRGRRLGRLLEFRVKFGRVHYRLLGFHGPSKGVVTLCEGFTHAQGSRAQREAMERALRRKQRVDSGESGGVRHVI